MADEVVSSSQATPVPQPPQSPHETPPTRPASAMTTGFQAVNARAINVENEGASSSTQPQKGRTPPPPASAVTHGAAPSSQSAQPQSADALPPASNANSSKPQDDNIDIAMTDAGALGTQTRSRNRTGNARPNYAEDQEMDFEYTSAATTTVGKKKAAQTDAAGNASASDPKRTQEFQKFIAVNSGANGVHAAAAKESTPGSATAPASKKRKAATTATATPPAASNSPAPNSGKKASGPAASSLARETNLMTFTKVKSCINKRAELVADDGAKLSVNDHVYLVCEPPGDPYYLCRIMEFLHVDSDNTKPVEALRVNWYYRPRDVQRFNADSRLVYGTMHSDICPLSSLRGKCTIKHRSEIDDLDAYRKERESFYFVQVFDRFIRRWYECIPVAQVINVPEEVKKVLDERWKFVVVEIGRVKELTSAVKTCKRCAKYCASHDSVDCAICKNSYHMNCVQPPLPKKPSRGFAWACGPCSRASERQQETQTSTASGEVTEAEEEVVEEEEVPEPSNDVTRAPSPNGSDMVVDDHPATQAEIALAKMWPMRYLGVHCRVEDALQYDDRAIYPRASTRLGPRHQANVNIWHGRPVELVKPAEIKKRYQKGNTKNQAKITKEAQAAIEADREEKARRPKWVQDEPPGYVARGEDYPEDDPRCTAKLLFKMPEEPKGVGSVDSRGVAIKDNDHFVKDYQRRCKQYARGIGVPPFGVNFIDKAMELLYKNSYDIDAALKQLQKMDRVKDLHEPVLTKAELIRFEEGVAKYGSEHRLIRLHMKTNLPNSDIVRFYYLWKKTPKGREIWGSYGGRKGGKRKIESDSGSRAQAEVAHDADDSAFDNEKAVKKGRDFQCKFCQTNRSTQWRKAPGVAPGQTVSVTSDGKKEKYLLALCLRCAGLWRKYAIQWEDIDEVAKKVAQSGGRAWKKRIDEELLRELIAANAAASAPPDAVPSIEGEPPKKKSKTEDAKKKEKLPPPPKEPTPPPPPIIPAQPTWRVLPCAVCKTSDDTIACDHCKLTVHRHCYGLKDGEGLRPDGSLKWVCDQCQNDRNPVASTDYSCVLCLTEETIIDLVEPPKISHKKKTDREREKERLEKELADNMRADYRARQLSLNRPIFPREPLKRTTGNNWVHVYCAVFTPEIRFSDAKALEVAEGFQLIPQARHDAICKLCKNKDHHNKVRQNAGACVTCFQCAANVHASCAFEAGYLFGFDVTPVKGSRKDQVTTAKLGGESGALTAGIWCKEHSVKSPVHPMYEIADDTGRTALQVFVETYKQADLTLTGTVRKANLAQLTKDKAQQSNVTATNANRRESAVNSIAAAVRRGARNSSLVDTRSETDEAQSPSNEDGHTERHCVKCDIDVTPKWHLVLKEPQVKSEHDPVNPTTELPEHESSQTDITGAPAHHDRSWDKPSINNGSTPVKNGALQHAASADTITVSDGAEHYLCHKCFLKKKLDPTPPPSERPPPPAAYSPPRQYSTPMDWARPSAGPDQPPYDHAPNQPTGLPRMPWEDPHRGNSAPRPPAVNGVGPPPHYGAPGPGSHYATPNSAFAGQPNGYHAPPPSGPHGAPPGHDRHPAYGHPAPPPHAAYPPPQNAHLAAPNYPPPPPAHAAPNGIPSPHTQPPPLHQPQSYGPPPPQQYAPPRHADSPYFNAPPPGYAPLPQRHSPLGGHARLEGYPPGRATTPRPGDVQANGNPQNGPGGAGASASPSLRNLLH